MGASILSRSSVLIIIYSYSQENFFYSFHLFFVLWYYFEIDRIFFIRGIFLKFFFKRLFGVFYDINFVRVPGKIIQMTSNNVSPWLK